MLTSVGRRDGGWRSGQRWQRGQVRLLSEARPQTTAWDLERHLWEVDGRTAVDPEQVAALGQRLGRTVRLIPGDSQPGQFDAVFESVESVR